MSSRVRPPSEDSGAGDGGTDDGRFDRIARVGVAVMRGRVAFVLQWDGAALLVRGASRGAEAARGTALARHGEWAVHHASRGPEGRRVQWMGFDSSFPPSWRALADHVPLVATSASWGMLPLDAGTEPSVFLAVFSSAPRTSSEDDGEGHEDVATLWRALGQLDELDLGPALVSAPAPAPVVTVRPHAPATTTEPPPVSRQQRRAVGTELVLLVDDEPAVRSVIRRVLQRGGYRVVEAADGLEALALLEGEASGASLVVTDVVMPTMGGCSLVERLRAERPAMPVLMTSGYPQDQPLHETLRLPAVAFLQKPFGTESFLTLVRALLDGAGERRAAD